MRGDYSTEQRIFIGMEYGRLRCVKQVQINYRRRFRVRRAPTYRTIILIHRKLEETGSVADRIQPPRPNRVRTRQVVAVKSIHINHNFNASLHELTYGFVKEGDCILDT